MGIIQSVPLTGGSVEQQTHTATEEDQQIAIPLSTTSPEIFS